MSIQAIFDQEAINCFPKIVEILKTVEWFEANQIRFKVLYECKNLKIGLGEMKENELKEFENDLIEIFKYNDWI